jgi:RHS repeat-associated protein
MAGAILKVSNQLNAICPRDAETEQGGGVNTHGFTGKELDTEMGLNYFCLRYYDPQIGRFMTLDPVDQKGASPYAYCFNNPLTSLDPTGAVREDYVTPIRTQQGHARGGRQLPYGWAPVHHTEEENLWHEIVMERWTAGRFYLSGFGCNWFLMLEDVDPYLFAGPVHEIVPYDKGALCWDWEIGEWYYLQPGSFSDIFGGIWSMIAGVSLIPISYVGFGIGLLSFDLPRMENGVAVFESTKGSAWIMLNILKMSGTAVGNTILGYVLDEGDLRHEMEHVRQWNSLGVLFPFAYYGASGLNVCFHIWETPYKGAMYPRNFGFWWYWSNPYEIKAERARLGW